MNKEKSKNAVVITKGKFYFLVSIIFLLLFLLILSFTLEQKEDETSHEKKFLEKYSIFSLTIPDSISFAGENVPVEYFDVKESLDRELLVNTYWQSQTLLFIKRSHRYFPVIEPILEKHNVPEDFKYLAIAESGLTNAVSFANAKGFWQFLKGTARDYGLEVNKQVDERFHLEKATEAACKYFLKSYEEYGNWVMVAASYNRGRNGMSQQVEQQKSNNYFDLSLNEETSRYVYRIIAIKLILENPTKYGFYVRKDDLYPPLHYKTIVLDSSINDMAGFANQYHTSYKMLKIYNPWIRTNQLNNPYRKSYIIKIPQYENRQMVYSDK